MGELPSNGQANADAPVHPSQWSNEVPTAPGIYWWRYETSKLAMIVLVSRRGDGRLQVWDWDGADMLVERWPSGLWAGPIEPPPIEE